MEYLLVSELDAKALSARITELLADGWTLYGNPIVTPYIHESNARFDDDHTAYSQAIVKGTIGELRSCAFGFCPVPNHG
jgi:hypothetical protein